MTGLQKELKRGVAVYLPVGAKIINKSSCFPLSWYTNLKPFLSLFSCFSSYDFGWYFALIFTGYGMECSVFMRGKNSIANLLLLLSYELQLYFIK